MTKNRSYYKDYPSNWKTHIRPAILKRANNKCEFCGMLNYDEGFRYDDGTFKSTVCKPEYADAIVDERKIIKIVLTVAHLDHDLTNNDGMDKGGQPKKLQYANLVALCQRCHNNHDAKHRADNRKNKINEKQMELF